MTEKMPAEMLTAMSAAPGSISERALWAFYELEHRERGLGWLSLWKFAAKSANPEAARTLSYALAKAGGDHSLADAVRLWFLRSWSGNDLSTIVNVITGVERATESETLKIPETIRSSVAEFLSRCTEHQAALVRHSVLHFLEFAMEYELEPQFIWREIGGTLASALQTAIDDGDEDEKDAIEFVCARLVSEKLPASRPVEPAALRALLKNINDAAKRFAPEVGELSELLGAVRTQVEFDEQPTSSSVHFVPDFSKLAELATLKDRYKRQLDRVKGQGQQTDKIEEAVNGVLSNLPPTSTRSLVVYGDPQSGKTEMMICLTARLLDEGYRTIVHLMNDSVDLLVQSLGRFRQSGLAPAPKNASELASSPPVPGHELVVFCKKNAKDLSKLIKSLGSVHPVVVIDDEADYATPNAKVNSNEKTKINELVSELLGADGKYIGVTATPARLNLNNTFSNRTETWVRFGPHKNYTGHEVFFPQTGPAPYRLKLLDGSGSADDARNALARFLVTVAHLNTEALKAGRQEENYTFLVHTSGKTEDHKADLNVIRGAMNALINGMHPDFKPFVATILDQAGRLYPNANAQELAAYVVKNASRSTFVVLNSKRDRAAAGDNPTEPRSPFTIIIGGNIVSRGVTFPNLLSMFFTRDVTTKLQQDTYIQRARMFGSRGKYLPHFELTIPKGLYADWRRCFVFHQLALDTIENSKISPVWVGDSRISIAASSSVDRGTVDLDKGEMSFGLFECPNLSDIDAIVDSGPEDVETLARLAAVIGDAMPGYLIRYLRAAQQEMPGTLAIHKASSIEGYGDKDVVQNIARVRGFIGDSQLERARFPKAIHHVKIFYNGAGKARVFYKNLGGVLFVQNILGTPLSS